MSMERRKIEHIIERLSSIIGEAKRKRRKRKKRTPTSLLYYMDYNISGGSSVEGGEGGA
jgi:hypothetical protein